MKFGMRTPSLKKSLSARTTGQLSRAVKRAANPVYGKKGMGLINDPKKAVYNKVYSKTTVGVSDVASSFAATGKHIIHPADSTPIQSTSVTETEGLTTPAKDSSANMIANIFLVLGIIGVCMVFSGNLLSIVLGVLLAALGLMTGIVFKFIAKR